MAHVPYTWKTSDPITADKMNNLQEGITEAKSSITSINSSLSS